MDKVIYQVTKLHCSPEEALEMFTVSEHLQRWLTEAAEVEPNVGGKYELFWNSEERENDSTIGCRVLALQADRFLAFEWKGPKHFRHFMNEVRPLTNVSVSFIPCPEGTEIHLLHTGWRDAPEWEEAREWFDKAWANALPELGGHLDG